MASDDVSEMKVLVEKLSSDTVSTNKKSLTALAKLTKKTENVIKLRRNGGLERLLDLIQRSNPKLTDMALSVLANCSLEVECRQEVKDSITVKLILFNGGNFAYCNILLYVSFFVLDSSPKWNSSFG